ncbi:hypothetical protein ACFORJ_06980 [Corynebacterium hansenii]|uniref:Uncharacterized protein n=1 Tax=Corynebacterium hansenii TaxID=394964 RepID=A0ABV7ZRL8_9CORY|nr:hypothetical protein [Corynebacterium hansenii]
MFTRTGVPGVERIDVYPGGRIVIGGDVELTRPELAALVDAVVHAGFAARDHDTRPIRRPTHITDELHELADRN